jgi:ribonuclease P protein component
MRERLARVPSGSLVIVRGLAPASSASYQQLGRDLDRALDRLLGAAAR